MSPENRQQFATDDALIRACYEIAPAEGLYEIIDARAAEIADSFVERIKTRQLRDPNQEEIATLQAIYRARKNVQPLVDNRGDL